MHVQSACNILSGMEVKLVNIHVVTCPISTDCGSVVGLCREASKACRGHLEKRKKNLLGTIN